MGYTCLYILLLTHWPFNLKKFVSFDIGLSGNINQITKRPIYQTEQKLILHWDCIQLTNLQYYNFIFYKAETQKWNNAGLYIMLKSQRILHTIFKRKSFCIIVRSTTREHSSIYSGLERALSADTLKLYQKLLIEKKKQIVSNSICHCR